MTRSRSRVYGATLVRCWCGARQGPGTMSDYTGAAGEAQSVLLSAVPAASLCLRSTSWAKALLTSDPLSIQGKEAAVLRTWLRYTHVRVRKVECT